jgi:zinc/manganese transport system substrate-binding protein
MKRLLVPVLMVFVLLLSMSCRAPANTSHKSIIVTYSILGSIVKELVGDQASVIVSIPNGMDPHEWEPSAQDIEAINKADLVVQNGLNLEEGLESTLAEAERRGVKFFSATDHIIVRRVAAGEGIPSGDPDQVVGAPDPHFWMDPLTIKDVVTALTSTLKTDLGIDVTAKATGLESRLDALNSQLSGVLSIVPEAERKLITGHESMGYFAQRYGFKLVGVIIPSLSSQAEVTAGDIADLIKVIQENRVKSIFTELGTSPAVARAVSQETGVKVVEIITHGVPADGSYFTFMTNLANTIADALK